MSSTTVPLNTNPQVWYSQARTPGCTHGARLFMRSAAARCVYSTQTGHFLSLAQDTIDHRPSYREILVTSSIPWRRCRQRSRSWHRTCHRSPSRTFLLRNRRRCRTCHHSL
ncbi:hypothetical protein M758_8G127000 [Ceratodon purpureus]|nr:hypothetical protein M758_8G127000 [Ceratodon purpureus]